MADGQNPLPTPPPVPPNPGAVEDDLSRLSPFRVLANRRAEPGASVPVAPAPVTPAPAASPPGVQPTTLPVGGTSAVPVPSAVPPPAASPAPSASLPSPSVPQPPPPQQSPPAPAADILAIPSREELLRQAAENSTATFILPTETLPPAPAPAPSAVQRAAASVMVPIGAGSVPPPPQPPPVPVAKPGTAVPVAGAKPVVPVKPLNSANVAQAQNVKPGVKPVLPVPPVGKVPRVPGKRRNLPLILTIIFVILFVVLGGASFLLASSGVRIPLLYTLVSGLPSSNTSALAVAQADVAGRSGYSFTGKSELKLPTSNTASSLSSSVAGAVYDVLGEVKAGTFTDQGATVTEKSAMTINGKAPLTLVLHASTGGQWLAYFSDTTNPETLKVDAAGVKNTLLYPVVAPPSLEALLAACKQSAGYNKTTTLNGTKTGVYEYTVDSNALSAFLPNGATLKDAVAAVYLAWKGTTLKTGQPVAISVKGTLSYLNVSYDYTAVWTYSNWDQPASDDAFTHVVTASAESAELTPAAFASYLGILSLDALPNSTTATSGSTGSTVAASPSPVSSPTPTPSEVASPSASPTDSASATSSPAATGAVTPSGQTTTVVITALNTQPARPAATPTAEAQQRDTQRLKDLADLKTALENYKKDLGSYPISTGTEQVGSSATLVSALVPTYITGLPLDPLASTYWYEYTSNGTSFRLRSVAEDAANSQAHQGEQYTYFEVTN